MATMNESKLNTVEVPPIGATNPSTIYVAAQNALRVLVRNVGGSVVILSHDAATLQQPGVAGTFQLPPGSSEVFVLAPRQPLLAAASGGGSLVSVAVSEALPLTHTWMET